MALRSSHQVPIVYGGGRVLDYIIREVEKNGRQGGDCCGCITFTHRSATGLSGVRPEDRRDLQAIETRSAVDRKPRFQMALSGLRRPSAATNLSPEPVELLSPMEIRRWRDEPWPRLSLCVELAVDRAEGEVQRLALNCRHEDGVEWESFPCEADDISLGARPLEEGERFYVIWLVTPPDASEARPSKEVCIGYLHVADRRERWYSLSSGPLPMARPKSEYYLFEHCATHPKIEGRLHILDMHPMPSLSQK